MAGFNFSRDFEREVNRAVQSGLKNVAAEYQSPLTP